MATSWTYPHRFLETSQCHLEFRQQPSEALVTVNGREKARKPVDPPPMVQLMVDSPADPQQNFLQNPYLFATATLFKSDKREPIDHTPNDSLTGTLVSSLHRLKDEANKDAGFFVFGDISIKVQGAFRLCISLYEIQSDPHCVQSLGAITSDIFHVVAAKDFKGLTESTVLSRAFSDQGVRLRLRKEPKHNLVSNKRSLPLEYGSPSKAPVAPNVDITPAAKRRYEHRNSSSLPGPNASISTHNQPYSYPNAMTSVNIPHAPSMSYNFSGHMSASFNPMYPTSGNSMLSDRYAQQEQMYAQPNQHRQEQMYASRLEGGFGGVEEALEGDDDGAAWRFLGGVR